MSTEDPKQDALKTDGENAEEEDTEGHFFPTPGVVTEPGATQDPDFSSRAASESSGNDDDDTEGHVMPSAP